MKRYFFNFLYSDGYVLDPYGVEAPSLEEAKSDAREAIQALSVEDLETASALSLCSINICDGDRRVLANINTAEALAGLMALANVPVISNSCH